MTELVIVSGKGGTGKTSLVGSFAALATNKVMVDCDVDAADLHLILSNQITQTTEFIGGKQASIDPETCSHCGVCQDYCRFDAIRSEACDDTPTGERYWIDRFACDGCGVCVRHCPEGAIDFNQVTSGQWFYSDTPYGSLIHARLGLAQANSGKLVSLLRQQARLRAEQEGRDLIIIDGPPGIGCPVIASITGANYVLIVTEPSLSAIHDMGRLFELTRHFNIPTGICVNRSDINPELTDRIADFAARQKVKVLGRIPYDPAITEAQLARSPVVERFAGGIATYIETLWADLVADIATAAHCHDPNLTQLTHGNTWEIKP